MACATGIRHFGTGVRRRQPPLRHTPLSTIISVPAYVEAFLRNALYLSWKGYNKGEGRVAHATGTGVRRRHPPLRHTIQAKINIVQAFVGAFLRNALYL